MRGLFDGTTLPEPEFRFEVVGGDGEGWRPIHLHLTEGLSRVYEASVLLAHPLPAPAADSLFEKNVGLEISRGAGGRHVRGLVRRVESLGSTGSYGFVRLVVVPELWTLSLRQNSRIWQDLPVAAIVREVLRDAGLYQGDGALAVAPALLDLPPREYCVQYRETDLAFVMRLLEEEGVPFYFKHDGPKEALVLAEREHRWAEVPTMDGAQVRVLDEGIGTASVESVQWLDARRQLRSTGAVLRDYDFTHPDAALDMTKSHPSDAGRRAVYDYPAGFTLGAYNEGAHAYDGHHGGAWARARAEELRSDAEVAEGRTNVTGMTPGMRFKVAGHLRDAHDRGHLVVSAEHHAIAWGDISDELRGSDHFKAILRNVGADFERDASGDVPSSARYWNRVACVSAEVPWRPARVTPRPSIPGPQTALVMAEPGSGEEICVDFHGRILVRFHWERPDQRSASQQPKRSSCWIRVAQTWAGAAWGAMFIPRVGMEAVVHFLEGDPDRPLVTGCVYNGKNHAPYELPQHKTRSSLKTLSSPGGDGYNELRFEDLKDQEQVWLHAQRDYDVMVRHDATVTVGHDRTHTVHHDEQLTVFNNRAASIRRDDSLEVEGDRSVLVHGGAGLSTHVDARYRLNADAGVLITCGASSIEMLPDRVTISSKTVNVVGAQLVNVNGALVKINCDPPKVPAKTDVGGAMATMALSLMGKPGSLLDKVKGLIDPKKLAAFASGKLGDLLKRLGVPQRITDRLTGLAGSVIGELATALREGRAPNWGRIGEAAIGTAVGIAVGEVFRPLERLPAVRNNRILSGMVREARESAETAATYGALHAAGLNEGMARDPFWQVMRERHEADWKGLLGDVAKEAGQQVLDGLRGRRGQAPAGPGAGDVTNIAMERGAEAGVAAAIAPSGGEGGAGGEGGGAGGNAITAGQLRSLVPRIPADRAESYSREINRTMEEFGINTRERQAAFLAQIAHESDGFQTLREYASGAAYEGRRDLGNINPGDGERYRGRGAIQLTGRANYREAGRALGLDLENHPELAENPAVAFRVSGWYWQQRGLNDLADQGDFRQITRRINGGYNGMESREWYHERANATLQGGRTTAHQ